MRERPLGATLDLVLSALSDCYIQSYASLGLNFDRRLSALCACVDVSPMVLLPPASGRPAPVRQYLAKE